MRAAHPCEVVTRGVSREGGINKPCHRSQEMRKTVVYCIYMRGGKSVQYNVDVEQRWSYKNIARGCNVAHSRFTLPIARHKCMRQRAHELERESRPEHGRSTLPKITARPPVGACVREKNDWEKCRNFFLSRGSASCLMLRCHYQGNLHLLWGLPREASPPCHFQIEFTSEQTLGNSSEKFYLLCSEIG